MTGGEMLTLQPIPIKTMDGPFQVWVCSDVPLSVLGALLPALWSAKDGYSTIIICYCHFLKIIDYFPNYWKKKVMLSHIYV